MTYFHVSSPLLNELHNLLAELRAFEPPKEIADRAAIAQDALSGVNASPTADNVHCTRREV